MLLYHILLLLFEYFMKITRICYISRQMEYTLVTMDTFGWLAHLIRLASSSKARFFFQVEN